MTPTSPITPSRQILDEAENIELYEQDNLIYSSQESLLEMGKLGLHLIEDLKSKNLLVEQLSNRLRMIYSSPCLTPDLSSEFAGIPLSSSNSYMSSIPQAVNGGSSGTVSPSFPQGVFGECLDKAEKEIERLDHLVLAQSREIEALKNDLSEADAERERFRQDRIKLKKDILELQVLLKRKDNSENLIKVKERLISSVHASVQTAASKNSPTHIDAFTECIPPLLNESKKDLVSTGICTDISAHSSAATQTSLREQAECEKISFLQQVIDDERILYKVEIDRLNKLLIENVPLVPLQVSVGVSTASLAPCISSACNTDSVKVKHVCLGPDSTPRFSTEWTQCDLITSDSDSVIQQLAEENRKLREKYMKYRSELAKRRNGVSVASGADWIKSLVDRQTDTSAVSTIDSIVQVDDPRDERLFILEADLRFAGEERDALVAQIEELESELDRITQFEVEKPEKLLVLESAASKFSVFPNKIMRDSCTETTTPNPSIRLENKNVSTDPILLRSVETETITVRSSQLVQAEDRSQLETIKALSEELISFRSKPALFDSGANTDSKSFTDAQSGPSSCFSTDSAVGPEDDMSPTSGLLHQLITSETSTQVADKQLENEIIISLQKKLIRKEKLLRARTDFFENGIGKSNAPLNTRVSPARDNSFDISAIAKPFANTVSLTTCSPQTGGTFDFSISSLQNQALSSLSPKRIPFSTPDHLPKDPDGDVVMRTAPRTQIRHIPLGVGFAVHEDTSENLDKQENLNLKQSLKKIRDKAFIAHSLSERIGALTSLVDKNRV